jgi:twinkle protein
MNTFFPWDQIEVKGNPRGAKKTLCPLCSHNRKKKTDPCLSVNFDTGKAKCWNCDALSFREQAEVTVKPYTLPAQNWQNYTTLSEKLVKWCESERKVRQSTLIDLGITEEKAYVPALGKETNCLTFNYFEGDRVVNKKYRDARKNFTQSKNGKAIFYNINSIIGATECYIVEGEFDVLAMHTHGIKNVVSVPNGANDHDDYWINSEPYLKDIERFIIATDTDEKGVALRERIAQRLGRYRCTYIDWTHKDANGSLIEGCISEDLANVKRFAISGTFTVSDLYDGMIDLYDNGLPKTIKPKHESFGAMRDIFSVMRGHLVTVTGIPSHGKSAFTEWHVLNLVNDHGMKASFFSPEHSPMELHQTTFAQKAIGRNFWKDYPDRARIQKEDLQRYREWADQRIYLTGADKGETPTWDWIMEKFKDQMFTYGIDIFIIDAFNKVSLPKGNKLDEIGAVLTRLTAFAQANDVIVFLVAHPTKMKINEKTGQYGVPTLYDVSGSADFRNQTHDGYSVFRTFPDACSEGRGYTSFHNLKTKFQFQGDIGASADFEYDIATGRYYAKGTAPPLFDMTRPMDEQTLPPIKETAIRPNVDFSEPLINQQDENDKEDFEEEPF